MFTIFHHLPLEHTNNSSLTSYLAPTNIWLFLNICLFQLMFFWYNWLCIVNTAIPAVTKK